MKFDDYMVTLQELYSRYHLRIYNEIYYDINKELLEIETAESFSKYCGVMFRSDNGEITVFVNPEKTRFFVQFTGKVHDLGYFRLEEAEREEVREKVSNILTDVYQSCVLRSEIYPTD